MSSANKKDSGYSGSRGAIGVPAIYDSEESVDLFATNYPAVTCSTEVYPTRDGKNVILASWGAKSGISSVSVYRVLSTNRPNGLTSDFSLTSKPSSVLTGFGKLSYDDINLSNGELYREYLDVNSDTVGKYVTILIVFLHNEQAWAFYYTSGSVIENRCITNAPTLSFDSVSGNLTISKAMAGRRIIEFYRRDRSFGYPTDISDSETLNEFQLTTLINMEGGNMSQYSAYYYSTMYAEINKWAKGTYTIGVQFNGTQNRTRISNAINNAITQINNVLNEYGVYFSRSGTSGDISIVVDSEYNLYGITIDQSKPQHYYGGTWETEKDNDGYIISANITLANDIFDFVPYCTYETVALEEITQSMGTGYDQIEYPYDTLHTEFNYLNKQSILSTKDKNILRLLYSDNVSAGDRCVDVSKKLNLPKGAYCVSQNDIDRQWSVQCTFLDSGADYAVRAWIVDYDGYMTYTSDWLNVTIPQLGKPSGLSFTSRINGGATFSWNSANLAEGYEIQAVRNYDGYISVNQTVYGTQKAISSLSAGTTYTIKVRAFTSIYGNKQYSAWVSIQFTTNPSRPVLNLISTKNGAIEVDWTLEDTTSDYTYIWINIYETADATEPLVGTTIESGSGKSGHVTLIIPSEEWEISDGETFYLRAQVMYYDEYVSGQNLKCLTDSGAEYTLTLYIIVSSRPDKFEWDTPKVGKNFKITTGEVNRLHENINAVRQYMKDYVSGSTEYSFTYVTVGMTFSAGLYNAWVSAIKGISGFGTYINYVSAGDRITADLLNAAVNELNSVEKEGLS